MRTATATPVCFLLTCPHCEEPLAEPAHGSFLWDADDYTGGPTTQCFTCKNTVRLPARFRRTPATRRTR